MPLQTILAVFIARVPGSSAAALGARSEAAPVGHVRPGLIQLEEDRKQCC